MLPLQYPSAVYNKLFTRILDSSIWLESLSTRIVWLTFIAVMDEQGFVQFASSANVAHRARVTPEEADEAIAHLEGPDANSSDPDNEGRRIERVPGGWVVLNAEKHRKLVTRAINQEQTRERVRKHRAAKAGNAPVTPSEAVSRAQADPDDVRADEGFAAFWKAYPKKVGKEQALKAWTKLRPTSDLAGRIIVAVACWSGTDDWLKDDGKFVPHAATWLNGRRWEDERPAQAIGKSFARADWICPHEPRCPHRAACAVVAARPVR